MNFEKSIVQITVQQKEIDLNHPLNNNSSNQGSGTGVFISLNFKNEKNYKSPNNKYYILTCYHVIENTLNIIVTVSKSNNLDKIKVNGVVKYIFPDDDLAVIEIEHPDIECDILDYLIITKPCNNIDTNTIGYPVESTNLKINRGVIAGFQDSNIQTDSTLNPGNSGGPLIIGEQIVGINQSKMTGDVSNTGFAIPIFRFLILWKLKFNQLKLINNKPNLLFKYQIIKQDYEYDILSYGVLITKIHKLSVLNTTNIKEGDYLLEINSNKISKEGNLKFDFFPDKISLKEIHLWFSENDIINLKYYSKLTKNIINEDVVLKYNNTEFINFYPELNEPYYYENNGLIISIFTKYHLEHLDKIEINLNNKIRILNRCMDLDHKFTIYLADLEYSKLTFTEYPLGEVIIEINDIIIDCIDTFKKIMQKPINKFKTITNQIYFC